MIRFFERLSLARVVIGPYLRENERAWFKHFTLVVVVVVVIGVVGVLYGVIHEWCRGCCLDWIGWFV